MTRLNILFLLLAMTHPRTGAAATRVKELASVEGVRENQLIGYGLVVGLAGTGDKRQTVFSTQSLANTLERMGVQVAPQSLLVRNTAAVMVTANLPPFAQPGTRIDVTVAAIGDASNLQGGILILTPLRASNGQIYAVAQGAVVTGGFAARRGPGNSFTVNHPTVGRVPGGAIVEQPPPTVAPQGQLRLQLKHSDFTTAARIAEAVNQRYQGSGKPVARAVHAGMVVIDPPAEYAEKPVEFLAEVEGLAVDADRAVKVVVNERTGTVVIGRDVRLGPVSILHGALSVQIETSFGVSQPAPFSQGRTTAVPQVAVGAQEERAQNITLKAGATVDDLVQALLSIGSTPRDIIAILQALRSAGALEAELEVI